MTVLNDGRNLTDYVTVSDGTKIVLNPNSPTGLKHSLYDPATGGRNTPFVASGSRASTQARDPRVAEYKPGDRVMHLGFFDDPRKAAYVAAKFEEDPSYAMDLWANRPNRGVRGQGMAFLRSLDRYYKFPDDLFTELPGNIEQIKAMSKSRSRAPRVDRDVRTGGVAGEMKDWNSLLQGLGIRGGQIAAALGGDRDRAIAQVLRLRNAPVDQAKGELKQLGIDLDDPGTVQKIKGMTALAESLDQSPETQSLYRILDLAGLRR